jgi:hypothetical protein
VKGRGKVFRKRGATPLQHPGQWGEDCFLLLDTSDKLSRRADRFMPEILPVLSVNQNLTKR